MGNDCACDVHRAEQIDVELTSHGFIGEGFEKAEFGISGVVYQHIDHPEPLDNFAGDRFCGLWVGDIERKSMKTIVSAAEGLR